MAKKKGDGTHLNEDILKQIKEGVLEGKSVGNIIKSLDVSEKTFYNWKNKNTLELGDKLQTWHRERLLRQAEDNLKELLSSNDENIKLKTTMFLSETLGKKWYSKAPESITVVNLPQPILDLSKIHSVEVEGGGGSTLIE